MKKVLRFLLQPEEWTKEECEYLRETKVSDIAVEVLAKNHAGLSSGWKQCLERYRRQIGTGGETS